MRPNGLMSSEPPRVRPNILMASRQICSSLFGKATASFGPQVRSGEPLEVHSERWLCSTLRASDHMLAETLALELTTEVVGRSGRARPDRHKTRRHPVRSLSCPMSGGRPPEQTWQTHIELPDPGKRGESTTQREGGGHARRFFAKSA